MKTSTDAVGRLNSSASGIRALSELLKSVIANPAEIQRLPDLRKALTSQGALAKYSDSERSIQSMSLNHMKKMSESALGSFATLDELRRSAIHAIETADDLPSASGTTRSALLSRISSLEDERDGLLEDLFVLQRAYDTRCIQARTYAEAADAATRERCKKEQAELDASFALRKHPVQSNVTPIDQGKRREKAS